MIEVLLYLSGRWFGSDRVVDCSWVEVVDGMLWIGDSQLLSCLHLGDPNDP